MGEAATSMSTVVRAIQVGKSERPANGISFNPVESKIWWPQVSMEPSLSLPAGVTASQVRGSSLACGGDVCSTGIPM